MKYLHIVRYADNEQLFDLHCSLSTENLCLSTKPRRNTACAEANLSALLASARDKIERASKTGFNTMVKKRKIHDSVRYQTPDHTVASHFPAVTRLASIFEFSLRYSTIVSCDVLFGISGASDQSSVPTIQIKRNH